MTKVEELTERIEKFATSEKGHDWLHGMLVTLISVATEEGSDEGWAATKMLWERMTKWNKEWQKENPKERDLTWLDAIDLIQWKIAAARAEGAWAELAWLRKWTNIDIKIGRYLPDNYLHPQELDPSVLTLPDEVIP